MASYLKPLAHSKSDSRPTGPIVHPAEQFKDWKDRAPKDWKDRLSGADLPEYILDKARLFEQLAGPTQEARHRAWGLLIGWQGGLYRDAVRLPAPYIYADRMGTIVFEWEVGPRSLIFRLQDDCISYDQADDHVEREWQETGTAEAVHLLRWLVQG